MYNVKLTKGDVLPIYLDFKNEESYWRHATLIEKIYEGDSFYLSNEKVYNQPEVNNNTNKVFNFKETNPQNIYYLELDAILNSTKKDIVNFCKKVKKVCNKSKLDNYNKICDFITKFKNEYKKPDELAIIFNTYSIDYLARYFQQRFYKDWDFTLFSYERWLVEIQPENPKFEKPFRTHRNIRKIIANCPLDSEININKRHKEEDDEDEDSPVIPDDQEPTEEGFVRIPIATEDDDDDEELEEFQKIR